MKVAFMLGLETEEGLEAGKKKESISRQDIM